MGILTKKFVKGDWWHQTMGSLFVTIVQVPVVVLLGVPSHSFSLYVLMTGLMLTSHRVVVSEGSSGARPGKQAAGTWAIESLVGSLQSSVLGEVSWVALVCGVYLPPRGRRRGCGGSNQGEMAETLWLHSPAWLIAMGRSSTSAKSVSE